MCHFNNSEGNARKTFTLILKGRTLNAGVYAAIGIAVVVFVIILSLLIRNIYFIKVNNSLYYIRRAIVNMFTILPIVICFGKNKETGQISTGHSGTIATRRSRKHKS